jgi:hypothetical protein
VGLPVLDTKKLIAGSSTPLVVPDEEPRRRSRGRGSSRRVGAPRWAMQGTLGLADGLPMVIHAR